MTIARFIIMLSLIAGLSACTSRSKPPSAWLQPGVSVSLPAPGISPAINQQQLLTATVNGQQHSLLVLLNADRQKLTLVGLSALGIRLFRLSYDDRGIHTEQSLVLPQLPPPNQVLADIMLSYWPRSDWQPLLPKGWSLTDDDRQRILTDKQGQVVSTITYAFFQGERQPVIVENRVFHYRIAIQRLAQ
ncbi:DUF3261 domain-containing protein [Biostraticola tofi]|uniref:Uncharacterized protein DUF3261 n=1 Tax=Biostraticola tofi TaxID=466109 RepID=A0A4R3YSH3_9GAMM|nr:uncharacterized protein DUF3261 [Biostraticola tofi]